MRKRGEKEGNREQICGELEIIVGSYILFSILTNNVIF